MLLHRSQPERWTQGGLLSTAKYSLGVGAKHNDVHVGYGDSMREAFVVRE